MQQGTNSPICWIGGKSLMAKRLIELFPPHRCYVEVFGGAGWVLFKKPYSIPNYREVYNDINGELVNMFRAIRENPDGFCREMHLLLISREVFNEFLEKNPVKLSEIQRAVRLFFLVKASFAGRQKHFQIRTEGCVGPNLTTIKKTASEAHKRLRNVLIENMDFRRLIPTYDRVYTLFYLDPPYWKWKGYDYNFEKQDYLDLRDVLRKIKGKFILSLDASQFIRGTFSEYNQREVITRYSCGKDPRSRGIDRTELVITNFDPKRSEKWPEKK